MSNKVYPSKIILKIQELTADLKEYLRLLQTVTHKQAYNQQVNLRKIHSEVAEGMMEQSIEP